MILALHVDVPYHDQWDLLPLLDAHYQDRLHWQDLLQPHNGHILFLPKLVMMLLAISTNWNTLAEVLFGFCCMLGCWFLLQKISAGLLQRALVNHEKICISLLVFSLSQAQNWLWGWQLQIPLALLFLLAGFAALQLSHRPLVACMIAVACGIAANLSFAGSLPFWIAAIPLVWQRSRVLVLPWFTIGVACLWIYTRLYGLSANASGLSFLADPDQQLRHLRNTLVLLGNLVARFDMISATCVGIAATLLIGMNITRLAGAQRSVVLAMALFSVGSMLMVSLSRAGMGDEQMLASRYGTLTLPFWMPVAMLLMERIQNGSNRVWLTTGALLLLCLFANQAYSVKDFRQLHNRMQRGAAALATIDSEEGKRQLPVINPRSDKMLALQEVQLLKQYRLSFFRHAGIQTAP